MKKSNQTQSSESSDFRWQGTKEENELVFLVLENLPSHFFSDFSKEDWIGLFNQVIEGDRFAFAMFQGLFFRKLEPFLKTYIDKN